MVKELACRKCKTLTTDRICPNCKSKDLSPDWSGLIIIEDVDRSLVAKTLDISRPGRYALKVT
ncbi:MAG: DNA-directed RNA polymerase, subunit E'' [archaeon]|nr:DNA-directed RNA polymerase, subunit E'' [archaeon]MCP8307052.1 DNA-directed RNA polymerase, subunit E'' [archaeon]